MIHRDGIGLTNLPPDKTSIYLYRCMPSKLTIDLPLFLFLFDPASFNLALGVDMAVLTLQQAEDIIQKFVSASARFRIVQQVFLYHDPFNLKLID